MTTRYAVVTGGGSGIGALLAEALAQRGLQVLCCGRRALPSELDVKAGGNVAYVSADVGTAEGRKELVSALPGDAALAVLVQNAAVGDPSPLGQVCLEHWRYALEVNVTAPLFLTQALLPHLERGAGRVLHLGTGVAHNPQQGTAVYGVTKAAFHRLYQQLNADLRGGGSMVSVGSVSPGVVDTAGVREHVEAARRHALPHVAWFDETYRTHDLSDPPALAGFCMSLLFDIPADAYRAHEWSFRNPEHRALVDAAAPGRTPHHGSECSHL